jgi:PAS domain S-box-containing protein
MRRRSPHRKPGLLDGVDLRAFLEQIPPVSYVVPTGPPGQVYLHISPQIEAMLGYPLSDWTKGTTLWPALVHPDDRERVFRDHDRCCETLEPWDQEYRMITRDDRIIWVHDQASVVTDERGDAVFWQGVMSDITAPKMAEQAIRESEERFRTLVEQVPAVVYLCTNEPSPKMLYISPQVQSLTGYQPEELCDLHAWAGMIHPDDAPAVERTWAEALRDDAEVDREYRLRGKDGRDLWVRDQNGPIRDEAGVVRYRQGVLYEVTDNKLWEESLRESEERYRTLVEQVPAVVYIDSNDARPRSLYVSPQVEPLFGYTPSQLMGDPDLWAKSIHPEDRADFFERWETVVESGAPFEAEYRVITSDDREVWVQDRSLQIRDELGRPLAWQGVIHDVTVEKRAAHQLHEAGAKYRALVENIPAFVYEVAPDGDGTTLYVSPQVERLLGYRREEWLDQPDIWMELLHPDDRERTLAAYDLHNETGEPWSREYRLIASDGRAIWFRDEATLARDASGRPLAWQGVRLDITAQKQAEEALRAAHDDLDRRVRDRTQDLEDANELMMLEVLERRRAEAALREAEERFRLLVERLPAVTYIREVVPNGDEPEFYTSPQIERLLGYTVDEWQSSADFWLSRVHPHDRQRVLAATLRCEATGEPFSIEYRYLAKDGHVVWVLDEASILRRTREGKPWLYQGLLVDVTDRKESVERMRHAEARALMMAEHLPAITYLWDRGEPPGLGPMSYVSPQITEILGYTAEEWLDDPDAWRGCLHPDDRDTVADMPYWSELPGSRWSLEYRLMASDGRVVWIRDTGRALPRDDGRGPILNGIMIDITAEKANEERLRSAEERYRTLVEQIPAITYIEEVEGGDPARTRMVFVSPQVREILGYEPDDLIAEPGHIERLVHPDDLAAFRLADDLSANGDPFHAEYRAISRDGREVWLQSQAVLVRDGQGQPRFWHGIALDITARKRAEEELRAIEAKFRAIVEPAFDRND